MNTSVSNILSFLPGKDPPFQYYFVFVPGYLPETTLFCTITVLIQHQFKQYPRKIILYKCQSRYILNFNVFHAVPDIHKGE